MKTYKVKEIYYTIQGEGYHSGSAAVFCRFAGCNLWSGLEKDRDTAICKFCDTDFWGTDGINGGKYNVDDLKNLIVSLVENSDHKFVVFTGGEPALQLDQELINALHDANFFIAIETNGTLALADGIDWVCVSPKANTEILVNRGHELKLVFPQDENHPSNFASLDFQHFYIQPKDDAAHLANTNASIAFVKANPKWKLSIQSHKYLNIP